MKKVILILLVLPWIIRAQGIEITHVVPTVICPGDSIFLYAKFIAGNSTQINLTGQSNTQVWQYSASYIKANYHGWYNGTDSLYTLRFKTNTTIGKGWANLWTYHSSKTYAIDAQCGLVTGIEALDGYSPQPKHFDMQGFPATPVPNTLLIEQRGNVRRKVLFME